MGRLSNISGKEAVKIFEKFGYILDHQTELAPGLLRSLIRQAEITVDEFLENR